METTILRLYRGYIGVDIGSLHVPEPKSLNLQLKVEVSMNRGPQCKPQITSLIIQVTPQKIPLIVGSPADVHMISSKGAKP